MTKRAHPQKRRPTARVAGRNATPAAPAPAPAVNPPLPAPYEFTASAPAPLMPLHRETASLSDKEFGEAWPRRRRPFWAAGAALHDFEQQFRTERQLAGFPSWVTPTEKAMIVSHPGITMSEVRLLCSNTRFTRIAANPKKKAAAQFVVSGTQFLEQARNFLAQENLAEALRAAVEFGVCVGRLREKNGIGAGRRLSRDQRQDLAWQAAIDHAFVQFVAVPRNRNLRLSYKEIMPSCVSFVGHRGARTIQNRYAAWKRSLPRELVLGMPITNARIAAGLKNWREKRAVLLAAPLRTPHRPLLGRPPRWEQYFPT